MKRFVSLDFLRGIAILMMLILHVILRFLDEDGLLAQMDNIPMINFVALFVLPFLGGLAGFFLLVSAIGNQVSMQRYIEKRQSPQGLILRQMLGGVILLFFAMLTEGLIGYHGALGQSFQYMGSPTNTIEQFWIITSSRYNHFETIHTIAWCIILNGLVQGLLARKGRWQNPKFMIKSYIILIIIVLVLTQPVWDILNTVLGGYPWTPITYGTYKTSIAEPSIIYEDFWVLLSATFLAPLAAPLEPILPYLAVSFIGSIIGIYITLPADKRPKTFIKTTMKIGLILFAIGLIGIVLNMVNIFLNVPLGEAASAYTNVTNHRAWHTDNDLRIWAEYMIPLSWFWQFIGLTGFAIMIVMVIFRMVEFRGKAENFAKRTGFIRRFGIVAFTNYNNQFIFYLVGNLLIWLLNDFTLPAPYGNQKLDWGFTGLIILLTLLIYHGINRAWEKVGYIGSIEWCMGTIGHYLLPRSKTKSPSPETTEKRLKWYEHGKIDVEGTFYQAQWINMVEVNEDYHKSLRDSQVIFRLATLAMGIPLFMPATMLLFPAARKTRQIEGKNQWSNIAYILSLIGTIVVLTFIVLLSILTLNML